jgi:hypothetical protein
MKSVLTGDKLVNLGASLLYFDAFVSVLTACMTTISDLNKSLQYLASNNKIDLGYNIQLWEMSQVSQLGCAMGTYGWVFENFNPPMGTHPMGGFLTNIITHPVGIQWVAKNPMSCQEPGGYPPTHLTRD